MVQDMDPSTFLHVNWIFHVNIQISKLSQHHLWADYPYSIISPFHFCKKSGVHVYVGLFLDFFCFTDLFVQNITVLISVNSVQSLSHVQLFVNP